MYVSRTQHKPVSSSDRRLWEDVTESLKQKDMEQATEHKRFLEERQRKEERHRIETETAWRTKYFDRKVSELIGSCLEYLTISVRF